MIKRTGSLYLHCDQTMSHYLKVLLDAIFGAQFFRSEITWLRTTHNDAKRWSPNADIILYYSKSAGVTWNPVYVPHSEAYRASTYRYDDGDGRGPYDSGISQDPTPDLALPISGKATSRRRMAGDTLGTRWPNSTQTAASGIRTVSRDGRD